MGILPLIVLGIVQGVTEFLPVSSSGHLVLLSRWLRITDSLFVSIILHLATLLSVLICLRKEVWQIIRHPFSDYACKLYIATIPTCILAVILMPLVNAAFSGASLGICFFLCAIILLLGERRAKWEPSSQNLTTKQAIIMGVVQGFAIFPGISRSGSTISGGLIAGGERTECAKFSFLMSIPIILMSLVMELYKIFALGQAVEVNPIGMVLSFIAAFGVGIFSIKFMLNRATSFKWFAIYLFIISILSIVF